MSDLVSGVLTRISEIEREQLAVLIDGSTSWVDMDDADVIEVRCLQCGWKHEGPETEADNAADDHLIERHPTPELRLCRAHRQIVEMAQRAAEAGENALMTAGEHARAATLDEVVELLAVGLGVVEEDRNGE